MRVAFGLKAHSGWAALVVVGGDAARAAIVDRRRLDLVAADEIWAKAPFHAAEEMPAETGHALVRRSYDVARRNCTRVLRTEVRRAEESGHKVVGSAVLMGDPMPEWSIAEILAVHFRMHKAEGVLWREALATASGECGLRVVPVSEKRLGDETRAALGTTPAGVEKRLVQLGRDIGPPWGKDQKDAALAALVALAGGGRPAGKRR